MAECAKGVYRPRRPRETAFYRLVEEHSERFEQECLERYDDRSSLCLPGARRHLPVPPPTVAPVPLTYAGWISASALALPLLLLSFLHRLSKARWSLSNLAAQLRLNLFTYRDVQHWTDDPFNTPPIEPAASGQEFLPGLGQVI